MTKSYAALVVNVQWLVTGMRVCGVLLAFRRLDTEE